MTTENLGAACGLPVGTRVIEPRAPWRRGTVEAYRPLRGSTNALELCVRWDDTGPEWVCVLTFTALDTLKRGGKK